MTRQRTQTVPGSWAPGVYTYLGYVNSSFAYPAIDSSFFTFTKLATGMGPYVWDAVCSGELFPGEVMMDADIHPLSFILHPCSPNPFNASTVLRYQILDAGHVSLKMYDIAGRPVATLEDGWRQVGEHQVTFDGAKLASGIYLVKLEAGEFSALQKMVLIK